ncbi:hypothetical protein G6N05_08755 [Flavobacterium sp. F372]|uniref:Peptidase S74 domain-containing protein n=1 Tax=Flavobacterium bernardetii TaxID=2813823 RepID=A0ABR7IXP2_9FLAO|nr:hypothetical protein [Flavobacterium bernardetii]MBC5834549.1 hypothetical protein [Flavobacterium bernardetii]NHF70197.1 hypothetical protein [Flavobacterium bernardetii]
MKKHALFIVFSICTLNAQVGIGTTTPEGALDLNPTIANNYGFVVPRIALTALNAQAPVVNPQTGAIPTGTVVYNTATANTGVAAPPNAIGPGLYFWNGTRWVAFAGSPGGLDWSLLGNGSTNIATDFIGTTDAVDFATRTNNIERMRVLSNGHILMNTTTNDVTTGADNVFEVLATTAGDEAISGYANGTGIGVFGQSTLTGTGVTGRNSGTGNGVLGTITNIAATQGSGVSGLNSSTVTARTGNLSGVQGQSSSQVGNGVSGANFGNGIGIYGQTTGGTLTTTASIAAVYGTLDQAVAGNQDVAGIIGTHSNRTQGTGGYSGPTAAGVNSSLAGVAGSFASKTTVLNTDSYFFGITGQLLVDTSVGGALIPKRTGGVLGENSGTWASLAYKSSAGGAGSMFGLYASTATNGNGAGKMSSPAANNNIGMGINGGFMGGYVQGSQYGLVSKGQDFGMYVDGNTITNKPYIQLIEGNNNRIATYSSTSTSVDVTTRGKGKLNNGEVFITFNEAFKNAVSTSDLSKSMDSEESINITVTPIGESNGLYISRITKDGFFIKENKNGKSNVSFNWVAIGTQKGYENGVTVSDVVLSQNFDSNMKGVMIPDTENQIQNATPIYFDGTKVRFEDVPEGLNKPKNAVITPKILPVTIEDEKIKNNK